MVRRLVATGKIVPSDMGRVVQVEALHESSGTVIATRCLLSEESIRMAYSYVLRHTLRYAMLAVSGEIAELDKDPTAEAMKQELIKAVEWSKLQPPSSKRYMPAIHQSLAETRKEKK